MNEVRGYKVFNPNWTCRGFQYEVGQTFVLDKAPIECKRGFHFCKKAIDCFDYYEFDPNNKVAEVIALGDISEGDKKCATNKLRIVRELSWHEVLDLVNTGRQNAGMQNTGHDNSGCQNTGDYNSGDNNVGDRNAGDNNTGSYNTGYWNSGNRNTGSWNVGNKNTGVANTGNMNHGKWNTGDFNLSDNNTGCFNTEKHPIKLFDVDTEMTLTQWRNSRANKILDTINFIPTTWIFSSQMSELEKELHPEHEFTGGYLRKNDLTNVYQEWWNELSIEDKIVITEIPNFDAEKFKKITGIEVEMTLLEDKKNEQ